MARRARNHIGPRVERTLTRGWIPVWREIRWRASATASVSLLAQAFPLACAGLSDH
jgi:hypothetical protein